MCLLLPLSLGPAIKVFVVIKVFVESSALLDNAASLSFAVRSLVTSLGSLLFAWELYVMLRQLTMSSHISAHVPGGG